MSVLPGFWSDTFVRGADYDETFELHAGSATDPLVDLTGSVVTVVFTSRYGVVRTYTTAANPGNLTHTGTGGRVTLLLSQTETVAFHNGQHDFRLTVEFPTGVVNTYIEGSVGALGGPAMTTDIPPVDTTTTAELVSGTLFVGAAGTYTLIAKAVEGVRFTLFGGARTATGSATVQFQVDGVNAGSAISVTTTAADTVLDMTVAAGSRLTAVVVGTFTALEGTLSGVEN